MKRTRLAACLFVPAIVAACSSFAGTNPADVPGSDAGDDAAADAGIDHVVTGTAMEAGVPNLLKDGTFETSCTALVGDHLSVSWKQITRTITRMARVECASSATTLQVPPSRWLATSPPGPIVLFRPAVFVLAASPTPALQANISTNVLLPEGIGGGGSGATTNLTTSDWTQLTLPTSFQSQDAHGATVTIDVYSADPVDAGTGTACIYVDDASLFFATK